MRTTTYIAMVFCFILASCSDKLNIENQNVTPEIPVLSDKVEFKLDSIGRDSIHFTMIVGELVPEAKYEVIFDYQYTDNKDNTDLASNTKIRITYPDTSIVIKQKDSLLLKSGKTAVCAMRHTSNKVGYYDLAMNATSPTDTLEANMVFQKRPNLNYYSNSFYLFERFINRYTGAYFSPLTAPVFSPNKDTLNISYATAALRIAEIYSGCIFSSDSLFTIDAGELPISKDGTIKVNSKSYPVYRITTESVGQHRILMTKPPYEWLLICNVYEPMVLYFSVTDQHYINVSTRSYTELSLYRNIQLDISVNIKMGIYRSSENQTLWSYEPTEMNFNIEPMLGSKNLSFTRKANFVDELILLKKKFNDVISDRPDLAVVELNFKVKSSDDKVVIRGLNLRGEYRGTSVNDFSLDFDYTDDIEVL